MKIFVTGAAGFIGSHLCERLLDRGDTVIALDNFNDYYDTARKRTNIHQLKKHPRCILCEADICDKATIRRIFAEHRPEVIVHLAAYGAVRYSIGRARLYTDVNIGGSINLLEAAREISVENFVFASTSSVYGNTENLPFVETDPCNQPLAPYPASKKAVELMGYTYHHLHGLNFTALRFFNVYGPRGRPDMMPFIVTDSIVNQLEIVLFDGGQMKRDWTYIDDIVDGVISALNKPLGYELINLGRGEPVLMTDFVEIIEGLVGQKAILSTPPAPLSEPKITFADIDKARRLLGYNPQTSLVAGLNKFWEWYQEAVMD
ncbi:NAD-dependent epimerase/dehydratase family protein [Candidatus Poribacteria bacterium]|nr:NAD-dependent epimerase/dehydratase family protein [Candidatus Poribacteria bacterium]